MMWRWISILSILFALAIAGSYRENASADDQSVPHYNQNPVGTVWAMGASYRNAYVQNPEGWAVRFCGAQPAVCVGIWQGSGQERVEYFYYNPLWRVQTTRPGSVILHNPRNGPAPVLATPFFAIRPVVARGDRPYFLVTSPAGTDQVRGATPDLLVGMAAWYLAGLDCNCGGGCPGFDVYVENGRLWSSDSWKEGYVGRFGCDTGHIGMLFSNDGKIINHVYYPVACNARGALTAVPLGRHIGYQCAGPVYSRGGSLIWPEACFVNATNANELQGFREALTSHVERFWEPRNYVPYVFDTEERVPVTLDFNRSGPPSLNEFSYAAGTVKVRVLDESFQPMGGWVQVTGRGNILIPVGAKYLEVDPPDMIAAASRYPGLPTDMNSSKTERIQLVAADLSTGKWAVLHDETFNGSVGPSGYNGRTFLLRIPTQMAGGIAIRGVGMWWGNTCYLNNRDYYNPDRWTGYPCNVHSYFHREFYNEFRQAFSLPGAIANGGIDNVPGSLPQNVVFGSGQPPAGNSIVHGFGVDFTGTAFQVFINFVPYHIEYPSDLQAPAVQAVQRVGTNPPDTTTGNALNIPYDAPYDVGVSFSFPPIRATVVYTDEMGVQRADVVLSQAIYTATLSYAGQTASISGSQNPGVVMMSDRLGRLFFAPLAVNPATSGLERYFQTTVANNSLSFRLDYRMYGDVTINYRMANGQTTSFVIRVYYPASGLVSYQNAFPVSYYERGR